MMQNKNYLILFYQDFMDDNRFHAHTHPSKSVLITLLLVVWTISGVTIIAAVMLGLVSEA